MRNVVNHPSREAVNDFINKNATRPMANKVLHAHPSPMHWKSQYDHPRFDQALQNSAQLATNINFYIGIPFCLPTDPPHCGFCLFPTTAYQGKSAISHYLHYLAREADLYKETYRQAKISSLYVGGGTPNLLAPQHYSDLIRIAMSLFPDMEMDIEKTLEGIPQLFSADKIKAIHESGFNRVSMGVQQLDDRLIQYSGRKQTSRQVFDAIEMFHRYELSCNVDMIYGWPEQSIDSMLDGLRKISAAGVHHITHYELNIAGRSHFATKRRVALPSQDEKYEMYKIAQQFLLDEGFIQKTAYDWERRSASNRGETKPWEYLYEQNLRQPFSGGEVDPKCYMGGLGYAAVNIRLQSDGNKDSFSAMNKRNLAAYVEDLADKRKPIERVYFHTLEDVKLCWIFQALQELCVNMADYRAVFGSDFLAEYALTIAGLQEREWVVVRDDVVYLVGRGEFNVPLIQAVFAFQLRPEISKPESVIPIATI